MVRFRGAVTAAVILVAAFLIGLPATAATSPDPWSNPLPGFDPQAQLPPADEWPTFTYPSAYRLAVFADYPPPDPDEITAMKGWRNYPAGTYERMLAKWRDKLRDNPGRQDWREHVLGFVVGSDRDFHGTAFERYVPEELGYTEDDFLYDHTPDGAPSSVGYDAFPNRQEVPYSLEVKDADKLSPRSKKQLAGYRQNVDVLRKQHVYIFRIKPSPSDLKDIDQENRATALNRQRIAANEQPLPMIVARIFPAHRQREPLPDPAADKALARLRQGGSGAGPNTSGGGDLVSGRQLPVDGGLSSAMTPDSAESAAAQQAVIEEMAEETGNSDIADGEELGGVDFSTLELRYVADTYNGGVGTGVQYAYKVDTKPGEEASFGGRRAAQLAADSFFTWLVLPPSSFTVNLNPDEPNRIIDAKLGKTDAGRVLLEADLQMKKTVGKLIHPDTSRGQAFWDALRGESKCISMRQWIVPRPAVVRENGNELFIIDAPLEVKMETEYFKAHGTASEFGCTSQSNADTKYNESIYRARILSELEKAVNNASDYADLRRVYASRVAAEWYRHRSRTKTTAYSHLVGSGDASAWPSRVRWDPKEVFNRFVKSYKDGEFRVERKTRQGNYIVTNVFVYGGVDLTNIPKKLLTGAEFAHDRPALDSAVATALHAPTVEDGQNTTWLGGRSTQRPLSRPDPLPTSPLRMPHFYLLIGLPVLVWLGMGAYLMVRRHKQVTA